jgi:oligoribonuclease NrnB/cAMP/cGMP phosphodiesterase (DHH superfamily)
LKVKLFTHTDLDGIGCSVLAKLAFEDLDITYCSYDDVDETIIKFVSKREFNKYGFVYITDLSLKKETADFISRYNLNNPDVKVDLNGMFQLLDHHPTAMELNDHYWCKVMVEDDVEKTSGTKLFYDDLVENECLMPSKSLNDFVTIVKRYDTWLWTTKYNDNTPKMWNDFFYILGKEKFINYVIDRIKENNGLELDNFANQVIELEQNKINKYIETKNTELVVKEILGRQAGVVFAENYISELGHELAVLHPELDFIAMISMKGVVSFRSNNKDLDLGKDIAKVFGGGGHPGAAGCSFDKMLLNNIISSIFSIT